MRKRYGEGSVSTQDSKQFAESPVHVGAIQLINKKPLGLRLCWIVEMPHDCIRAPHNGLGEVPVHRDDLFLAVIVKAKFQPPYDIEYSPVFVSRYRESRYLKSITKCPRQTGFSSSGRSLKNHMTYAQRRCCCPKGFRCD